MTIALLLSGGMDSIAIAYWKRPDLAVTVDYGQVPAPAEIRAASAVCQALNIEHLVVRANLSSLGSGDMAGRKELEIAPRPEWWPYRNQMLVTLAAMAIIPRGIKSIMIGTLASDGHHVDGKKAFVEALDRLLLMQEGEMRLDAPAIGLTAVELLRSAAVPLDILAWAHSCHTSEYACGECGGCRKHFLSMRAIGIEPY